MSSLIRFLFRSNAHLMLQAREKFLSLRKGTKSDIATVVEEVLFTIEHKVIRYYV